MCVSVVVIVVIVVVVVVIIAVVVLLAMKTHKKKAVGGVKGKVGKVWCVCLKGMVTVHGIGCLIPLQIGKSIWMNM